MVITDPSQLSPNPTIIDFEQFTGGPQGTAPVNNPFVVGDVSFSINGVLFIWDITLDFGHLGMESL
jgi:hypothetical protein